MKRTTGVLGLTCALAVAACSSAGESPDRDATEAPLPSPAPVATDFATLPPPVTTTLPTIAPPATIAAPVTIEPTGTVISTTPTSTVSPATTTTTPATSTSVAPVEGGDPLLAGEESEADEPTFDIGPPVAIDVDLARFPVDDAGQGGAPNAPSQGDGPGDAAAVTGWAAVDRYLASVLVRPGNTAASLAVSIGGDIVHTAAFGERDPSVGDPAESVDRFRIASISKPITAIVAMVLVEDGVIGLDDPIGQIIADRLGFDDASSGAQRLTLRQLLTHRSGFSTYQSTFFGNGADSCEDAARQGLARASGGGGYVYSNMNYCLAGLAIEALTGLAYEQAVYQYLLTPLGISGMRLPPTIDPGPDEVQHVTTPGRNYMETLGASGSWIATPTDLVTILDSLDLSTPGFKPLSQETVFSMVVPAGGQYGQRGYGLGLISYGDGRFGHTGTIESTHAMLLNRGDGVTWAITVAGQSPGESTDLERIMNNAFDAGGFVAG